MATSTYARQAGSMHGREVIRRTLQSISEASKNPQAQQFAVSQVKQLGIEMDTHPAEFLKVVEVYSRLALELPKDDLNEAKYMDSFDPRRLEMEAMEKGLKDVIAYATAPRRGKCLVADYGPSNPYQYLYNCQTYFQLMGSVADSALAAASVYSSSNEKAPRFLGV